VADDNSTIFQFMDTQEGGGESGGVRGGRGGGEMGGEERGGWWVERGEGRIMEGGREGRIMEGRIGEGRGERGETGGRREADTGGGG
jgi:hypothetical protein